MSRPGVVFRNSQISFNGEAGKLLQYAVTTGNRGAAIDLGMGDSVGFESVALRDPLSSAHQTTMASPDGGLSLLGNQDSSQTEPCALRALTVLRRAFFWLPGR
jgi:hypothetical protein